MGRKKQDAGTQRTYQIIARFRPEVKDQIKAKLAWLRRTYPDRKYTMSGLVRLSIWAYCRDADDPREP